MVLSFQWNDSTFQVLRSIPFSRTCSWWRTPKVGFCQGKIFVSLRRKVITFPYSIKEHLVFDRDKTRVIKWDPLFWRWSNLIQMSNVGNFEGFPWKYHLYKACKPLFVPTNLAFFGHQNGPEITHHTRMESLGRFADSHHETTFGPLKGGDSIRESTGYFQRNLLGGGNSDIFNFNPDPWGNDPIWLSYIFQMGWTHQSVLVGEIWFHLAGWSFDEGSIKMSDFWSPQWLHRSDWSTTILFDLHRNPGWLGLGQLQESEA